MMFKGLLFFLRFGWKHDKRYVLWNIFSQLLLSLMPVLSALMPKFIIDELMNEKRPECLALLLVILAGYTLLAGTLSSFFSHDGFIRRCRLSSRFDTEQHTRLVRADLERLESPAYLDMKEKAQKFLTCDFHGFGYLLDCALRIIGQSVTLIGVAALIASANIWIVVSFSLLAVVSVWFEGRMRSRAMEHAQSVIADQRKWMYYSSLFEDVRYAKEVRLNRLGRWLLGKEQAEISKCIGALQEQHNLFARADMMTAFLSLIQQVVSYGYLVWKVLAGALSIGDFTMYTGAAASFTGALHSVMNSIVEIRAYDMYYDKLDEFISVPESLRESGTLSVPDGSHTIKLVNVGFRYAVAERWALRHINLTLRPGEKLSIVGENGSGKTTLTKLLCRQYDPTEGVILLDGTDIRSIDYDRYMELFSAVFQDFCLFDLPLRDNIALGLNASDDEILRTLAQVGLAGFAEKLPNGLSTHIGRLFDAQGVTPSGGEGQRIALARALLRDAPIIILDEPTAALDPRAEYEIYQHFDALTEGKTAVYISHRLSSARFCDRIAVLHEGSLIEYGRHEQLMAAHGRYHELFGMQAHFYTDIG